MSALNVEALRTTGQLLPGTETFVSTTFDFASKYASQPGSAVVQFELRPGVMDALKSIGVRDTSALAAERYGDPPIVQSGWKPYNAFFKAEGTQINIGLGNGNALNTFNQHLIRFTIK